MMEMVRNRLKKHTYKIAFGVPFILLVASSLSLVRDKEEICIVPEDNRYVEVGETVTLQVIAEADEPINVIGATIAYPSTHIEVESLSRENSVIDLWSEEPEIQPNGLIHFSGGILAEEGFIGNGTVLTLITRPIKEGTATIDFTETTMLAHDGTGKDVVCGNAPIILSIRPKSYPSPDVNGDKRVNLYDFGIVSARLFMGYERPYDLNLDGKITISDIAVLIRNFREGSSLGSLAISWMT
jgi:hypothetical protein